MRLGYHDMRARGINALFIFDCRPRSWPLDRRIVCRAIHSCDEPTRCVLQVFLIDYCADLAKQSEMLRGS